jgi:ABC-type polysaccharide/polyol phosphate export permease
MAYDVLVSVGVVVLYILLLYALTSGRKGLRAAFALMRRHFQVYWSYKFAVFSIVLNFVVVGGLVLIVGKAILPMFVPIAPEELEGDPSFNYAAFLITGFVAWPLIWSGYNIASRNIRMEQFLGMFEVLMPTSVGVNVLPFAYLMLSLFSSMLTAVASLAFFHYFFDLPLHFDSPALLASLVAILAVSMFMAWGLGLVLGGLTTLVKEITPFSEMLRTVMLALSGVIVPVEVLPRSVRWLAEVLPLTHAFRALRLVLLGGRPLMEFWPIFLDLLLFSLLLSLLGIWLFEKALQRARLYGTLYGY